MVNNVNANDTPLASGPLGNHLHGDANAPAAPTANATQLPPGATERLPSDSTLAFSPMQLHQILQAFAAAETRSPTERERNSIRHTIPFARSKVDWKNFPDLKLSDKDNIDSWFMRFEAECRASSIPESEWAQLFIKCPKVPEHAKTRLVGIGLSAEERDATVDYSALRKFILLKHGPSSPCDYFMLRIHSVRCDTVEEAQESLLNLLQIYNRAARDEERQVLKENNLCYAFIQAIPERFRSRSAEQLAMVLQLPDALEKLFQMAKFAEDNETAPGTALLLNSDTPPEPESESKSNDDNDPGSLLAMIRRFNKFQNEQGRQQNKRPPNRNGCPGCGGDCPNRNVCPAKGRTCYKCEELHHFGKVCRNPNKKKRPNFNRNANTEPIRNPNFRNNQQQQGRS